MNNTYTSQVFPPNLRNQHPFHLALPGDVPKKRVIAQVFPIPALHSPLIICREGEGVVTVYYVRSFKIQHDLISYRYHSHYPLILSRSAQPSWQLA